MEKILSVATHHHHPQRKQQKSTKNNKTTTTTTTTTTTRKDPVKVVYISNPMKFKTSASKFRALVQRLTGRDAEYPSDDYSSSSPDQENNINDDLGVNHHQTVQIDDQGINVDDDEKPQQPYDENLISISEDDGNIILEEHNYYSATWKKGTLKPPSLHEAFASWIAQ
ncbi:hypothetical protein ACFE04_030261 [Oxalis oulophora]